MTTTGDSRRSDGGLELDDVTALTDIATPTDVQAQCVDAAVAGRDVLAVIATGGGKSAIYQLAGPLVDGVTVVVVPLLALAADQLHAIGATELPSAASIDGTTSDADRGDITEQLVDGRLEYLFVTPESLQNDELHRQLAQCNVSLFVVDEAHCVVTWGQSFRSDYLRLGEVRRALGSPTCIALTASADPRLRADLVRLLDLEDPLITVLPLSRPNVELSLHTLPTRTEAEVALLSFVASTEGKAIVYVPTTKLCEDLSSELSIRGRRAVAYHGRMRRSERDAALQALRGGDDTVVVATNAFGMGIDVPAIRSIVHLDLPATLIDYYQEVGRAGRDGKPSQGRAFVALEKSSRRTFTAGVRSVSTDDCARVLDAVRSGSHSKRSVAEALEMPIGRVTRAVTVLTMVGALDSAGELRATDEPASPEQIQTMCSQREEFHRSQREAVAAYRTSSVCRWQQLLASLGEFSDPCRSCDNCDRDDGVGEAPDDPRIGASVTHSSFGPGTIVSIDGAEARLTFDEVGPKTIDLEVCLAEGLIEIDEPSDRAAR